MNGAVVFCLALPEGGKTGLYGAVVQSRCLQKQGHERLEQHGFDSRNPRSPVGAYEQRRKLKVGASFQVSTIEQKAQPTLMHLLGLVKIKIRSWLGSCQSWYNYDTEDCCLNRSCYSTRLFKDRLGNLIHVRQDSGPNQEKLCCQLPVSHVVSLLGKYLEKADLARKRGSGSPTLLMLVCSRLP